MTKQTRQPGVAVIGYGNIAGGYLTDLIRYPEITVTGVAGPDPAKAAARAADFGVAAYRDVDELLADDAVDVVVDLATHRAHYEVARRCLVAGKHVHSEKPLASSYAEAVELNELAERKGLRLSAAPATFLGEGAQTALREVRGGRLGTIRAAYAEANWGRIESWHPNPEPAYEVGPMLDVGVYPLTMLTGWFGPARAVTAYGTVVFADRTTIGGRPFTIETPNFVVAMVELADGVLLRLTVNFYIQNTRQQGLELHGDDGSLVLSNWHDFDGTVEVAPFGGEFTTVAPVRPPHRGVEWGRAVRDLVAAIAEDRPHRTTGRQAAHVVDILAAVQRSVATGETVRLESTFDRPEPMPWAR